MKVNKIVTLVFGCLALLGAFMPLASSGQVYVDISYMGAITKLLYVVPATMIVASVISLNYGMNLKPWTLSLGGVGLVLSFLTINGAMSQVKSVVAMSMNMENRFNAFREGFNGGMQSMQETLKQQIDSSGVSATLGFGSILLVIAYLGLLIIPFLKLSRQDSQSISTVMVEPIQENAE